MKLPLPPKTYDPRDQAQFRATIEQADQQNLKRGVSEAQVLLSSPNGTVWVVTVTDAGVPQVVAY